MQLTAIEFAKLINDLRCDMRPEERRTNPRAPARSQVEVIPVAAGVSRPVARMLRVRDISRNGMGLISGEKAADGARFLVLLPKSATDMFTLLCEVARVTRLPGDAYGLGLRMVRRVLDEERTAFMAGSADALAALLAPPPARSAEEAAPATVVTPAKPAVAA